MVDNRRQTWLVAGFLGLALLGPVPATAAETSAPVEARQLVAVDGNRRLFLDCIGRGEPTIIFDAGYGSAGANWRAVQMLLAPRNRACAYDRAGMAHSDPPSRPSTPENVVDDLRRLVRASGIKTPFVLVGHSRGGFYATLYALTFRSDLAGMVLVDPAFAQNTAEDLAISPSERDYILTNNPKSRANLVRCEALAKSGSLSEKDPHGCFSVSASDTPEFREAWLRQGLKPEFYGALLSEFDSSLAGLANDRIVTAEQASAHPFGDLPLVVLTSSKPMQTGAPNPSDNAAANLIWKRGHDRLAAYSSVGRSLVVAGAGHMIQVDNPGAVADSVRTVLEECCRPK